MVPHEGRRGPYSRIAYPYENCAESTSNECRGRLSGETAEVRGKRILNQIAVWQKKKQGVRSDTQVRPYEGTILPHLDTIGTHEEYRWRHKMEGGATDDHWGGMYKKPVTALRPEPIPFTPPALSYEMNLKSFRAAWEV